jgi:hypothetical protein
MICVLKKLHYYKSFIPVNIPVNTIPTRWPGFLDATIKIDGTVLVGSIELRINSADWNKHGHDADSNYRNVILQVVWQQG